MMVVGPREEPGLALVDPWWTSPGRGEGHHEERAMAVVTVAPPNAVFAPGNAATRWWRGRNLAGSS